MASKGKDAVVSWHETAQPGDRFTLYRFNNDGEPCVFLSHQDGLIAFVPLDDVDGDRATVSIAGVVLTIPEWDACSCTPDHVGNMRRKVAGVLHGRVPVSNIVPPFSFSTVDNTYLALPDDDDDWDDAPRYESPEEAAAALIPDDWAPLGGEP